jgi:hypothetical protein
MFNLGNKKIEISCEGTFNIALDDLKELQGELKTLSEENYGKLHDSLVTYGFSFPVFVWEDKEGTKWIIDAHQRIRTLRKMRSEEGYEVPELPAVRIFAKDKVDAKKRLLLLNSKYGQLTESGLTDFINEPDASFAIEEIADYLHFDEIDFNDAEPEGDENADLLPKEPEELECPNCHHIGKQVDFRKKKDENS